MVSGLHAIELRLITCRFIDEAVCKAAGAVGVIRPTAETAQVIIGTQVQAVYDELKKLA